MLVVVELQYWKVCIAKYKIFFFVKSNFTNIFGKDIFFLALWFWNDLVGKNSNIRRLNLTYVTPILWFLISRIFFNTESFYYRAAQPSTPFSYVLSAQSSTAAADNTKHWPHGQMHFHEKFHFIFFRVTRRKLTAIKLFFSSFSYFLQLQDICFKSKTIVQVFLYLRKIFLNSLERGEKKLVKYIMLEQKSWWKISSKH